MRGKGENYQTPSPYDDVCCVQMANAAEAATTTIYYLHTRRVFSFSFRPTTTLAIKENLLISFSCCVYVSVCLVMMGPFVRWAVVAVGDTKDLCSLMQ